MVDSDGCITLLQSDTPAAALEQIHVFRIPAFMPADDDEFGDVDALVDELEAHPESAQALQKARQWVGHKFYAEKPTLTSLRLEAGLSQRELGSKCGLQQPHVSRYEAGKQDMLISIASQMASALGVSLDTFFEAFRNTREQVQPGAVDV